MDAAIKLGWAHLHLPRLKAEDPNCISLKFPGERIRYIGWAGMNDVQFRVQESGRLRCVRENVRNVHAWVVGRVVTCGPADDNPVFSLAGDEFHALGWHQALYDPYKGGAFVNARTFEPIHTARLAILSDKNVFYKEN